MSADVIYVCIYIYIHTKNMHVHIYIYIYTHTHILLNIISHDRRSGGSRCLRRYGSQLVAIRVFPTLFEGIPRTLCVIHCTRKELKAPWAGRLSTAFVVEDSHCKPQTQETTKRIPSTTRTPSTDCDQDDRRPAGHHHDTTKRPP